MGFYNRVILMGNICFDIELKYTSTGTAVTEVRLAVNDKRKSQSGETIEETLFVDVTLWGATAENANKYLKKGSPIFVEGRLKSDTWESDGQKRSKIRVVCEKMQFIGGGGGGGGRGGSREYDESEYSRSVRTDEEYTGGDSDSPPSESGGGNPSGDDIPF